MAEISLHPAAGKSLLITVPAWRRIELATVCYRQLRDLVETLRMRGLDAHVLVIGDDENLDRAAEQGHLTVEHENWLGAKLNVGYRAAKDEGFDYVCTIGSDSWMHADRLTWMPDEKSILCTRDYVCVSPEGDQQGWFRIKADGGVGTRIFPTSMLSGCNWAPLPDRQMSGCDTTTILSICRGARRAPHFLYTEQHPAGIVGFQSDVQITPYRQLAAHFLHQWQEPFAGLDGLYPAHLVVDMKALYARVAVPA